MNHEAKAVLLITGASRGIGAATALLAGARGYAVGVNYRNDDRAAEAVVRQIEQAGGMAVALQADVAREQDVLDLFEACAHRLGASRGLPRRGRSAAQRATAASVAGGCADGRITEAASVTAHAEFAVSGVVVVALAAALGCARRRRLAR